MSRVKRLLRGIAFKRDKIARASKYDKINISDDLRENSKLATSLYKRNLANFREIIRSDEDPIMETDVNVHATLQLDDLVFTAIDNGEAGNLISIKISDSVLAGSESLSVRSKFIHIRIEAGTTDHDAVKALIDASDVASALVAVSVGTSGALPVAAHDTSDLTGGI